MMKNETSSNRRITTRTTLKEIVAALYEDGFEELADRASELKQAAKTGCLLWTNARIVTTDNSRISARKVEEGPLE